MKNRIKYIFSINAGRSGSHYLSKIFEHAKGCESFHEPSPVGNGKAMRDFLYKKNEKPIINVAKRKVEIIKDTVKPFNVYVETNHCFVKGFGWFIPNYLPEEEIGIIHLSRNRDDVVASLLSGGTSPITPIGRDWIITPEVANPMIPPPSRIGLLKLIYYIFYTLKLPFKQFPHKRQRIYNRLGIVPPQSPNFITKYELESLKWYVDEINALGNAYRDRFPKMKYISVDINDLNTIEGIKRLFNIFGLREKATIKKVIGRPTNLLKRP